MSTPNRRTSLKALASAGIAAAAGSPSSLFAAAKISPAANSALIVVDVQNCLVTGGEADHKTATGLAGHLKARSIKTLFVVGLATDFSVAWTAMDARKAGFEVYGIEDATRAIDLNGSLAATWKQMAAKGVKRIQSGDVG